VPVPGGGNNFIQGIVRTPVEDLPGLASRGHKFWRISGPWPYISVWDGALTNLLAMFKYLSHGVAFAGAQIEGDALAAREKIVEG
jgi:hypothetical protein